MGEPNSPAWEIPQMTRRNIVLVGFMGTGKTTVGKQLAAKLGMDFTDMDRLIEERQGKTVARIFAEDGEGRFRQLERELVRELSAKEGQVIAAGGGIVLNPDNVADFSRAGLVVCLIATAEAILERVGRESHRPLLEGDDKAKRIRQIIEARRRLYAAIPNQVDTTPLTPEQVTGRILDMYR